MTINDLTIVPKDHLLKLENHYNSYRIVPIDLLTLEDITNFELMIPSLIKYLEYKFLRLKELKVLETDFEKGLQLYGAMDLISTLLERYRSGQEVSDMREVYNKEKERLESVKTQ